MKNCSSETNFSENEQLFNSFVERNDRTEISTRIFYWKKAQKEQNIMDFWGPNSVDIDFILIRKDAGNYRTYSVPIIEKGI